MTTMIECALETIERPEKLTEETSTADSETSPLPLNECKKACEDPQHRFELEPYDISADGHYIGCDGFVVPKNFQEYFEREPLGVRRFVMKNLRKRAVDDDVMDTEQDLLLYLHYLPEKSKYRKQGKTDVIECFDPQKQYGANTKRFHNWVSRCLKNRLHTLLGKRKNNPLLRPETLSITGVVHDGEKGHLHQEGEASAEYLYKHSAIAADRQWRGGIERTQDKKILVERFTDFVRKNAPELIVVMEALGREKNIKEAQEALGMDNRVFARQRGRLRILMDCLQTGREIPTAAQRRRRLATSRGFAIKAFSPTGRIASKGVR